MQQFGRMVSGSQITVGWKWMGGKAVDVDPSRRGRLAVNEERGSKVSAGREGKEPSRHDLRGPGQSSA